MTTRLFAKAGISLERLRTFVAIASAKGISNAAPDDPTRQSQFSRQLKELEECFGAELLVRGRGRFALTPAGRDLFQIVQAHFNAMENLADRCANRSIEMSIGAGESLLHWLLLPAFGEFRARHPAVTLVLHNLRTEEIVSLLVDGQLDAGLFREDAVRAPLKSARLGAIQYRVVIPRRASKPPTGKTVWAELARHPVALMAGGEITAAIEAEAEKKGIRLDVCLRASSNAQLVEAVSQLGCAAVLPTFAAERFVAECNVLPISALKAFTRTMAIAWNPRSCALRPAVSAAVDSLTVLLRQKLGAAC